MAETDNNSKSGASSVADTVTSTFEEEVERGERSRCEMDPNSEEVKLWRATRAERHAAVLKAHDERMKGRLPEHQEHGADHTSSPQVKGNYSQYDADMQARLEELIRKNREGIAEIKRFLDRQGLPWPGDAPRPSPSPAAPVTSLRTEQASFSCDAVSNANVTN